MALIRVMYCIRGDPPEQTQNVGETENSFIRHVNNY